VAKAEGLVAYAAVALDSSLLAEEHSLTLAEILAAAEVCAGAVHDGNGHRSVREAKPRELVACAGKQPGFGNAVASSSPPPDGPHP
jgi:hypothetical protein